ncbi:MAG: signal recognition particle-docking protein FtsY [Firmicutes bacterium]|nr:signal recognition particle-docking protein FtsY [Bacillota bacterium]
MEKSAGGFFSRLKEGLTRTRQGFVQKVEKLVTGHSHIDEELYEELEAILVEADVGVTTTMEILDKVREQVRARSIKDPAEVKGILKEAILEVIGGEPSRLIEASEGPTVIMVVGVNGVGKTTTIGKLAARFKDAGKRVILGAGDTFRAAAIDQLEIWAGRAGADLVRHQENSDPAAVAFDALQAARSRKADYVIVDTAGRLHTKSNLMEELKKVRRVIDREMPGAPHEVLLVLDATTGQNAVAQARIFDEAVGVTGIALTKLDGTAKGGVVVAVSRGLKIPVKLIGIGEQVDDLRDFVPRDFVEALFAE